jgi:hypothetical protein
MAQQKTITFKGIQRALPQSLMPDGACQEIINLRPRKGAWRPVGTKKQYENWNISNYSEVWMHDIENGMNNGKSNMIGYVKGDGKLFVIWLSDNILTHTEVARTATPDKEVRVVFLKRTMIVTSDVGVEVFLFVLNSETGVKSYIKTANLPVPDVLISRTTAELAGAVQSDNKQTGEAIIGKFLENINRLSNQSGKLYGSLMYIAVYRLFDGNYILPSLPRYVELYNGGELKYRNPGGNSRTDNEFRLQFYGYNMNATIDHNIYQADLLPMKDLIESICIFATKVTPLHQIDEASLSADLLYNYFGTESNSSNHVDTWQFKDVFKTINSEFKKLASSAGWYKIHEFSFEDVVGKDLDVVHDIDTRGYYQDYATRETLTSDQFSHHSLSAREAYVYNDRLHLLNIKTSLGNPYVIWPVIGALGSYPGKLIVYLKTSLGEAIITNLIDVPRFDTILKLPQLVGYNDSRAYRFQITVEIAGVNYLLFSENLIKNELLNFAFWHSTVFALGVDSVTMYSDNYTNTEILISSIMAGYTIVANVTDVTLPFDTNRLQVSEIQNPLVFTAKNSYQVGTGDGLAICAGSEPLSTGQFGQFPLQVFTSKGIYALEIGTSDVLYINILSVNGEVINNRRNVVALSQGVCYTTDTGLFIVNGRQIIELSEVIEATNASNISCPLVATTEIQNLITDARFVPALANSLSTISFVDYLKDSVIGYDHLNKEIVVTNQLHGYSYVYNTDNQIWYKVSQSYRLLINTYPKLLGINSTRIMSLSDETDTDFADCLIISSAQSLESHDAYKRLERSISRCLLNSPLSSVSGFYIFGSDDLSTWKFLVGSQRSGVGIKDLMIHRTHGSAKYYAFVVAGRITTSSEIKQIDLLVNTKWNNRLR